VSLFNDDCLKVLPTIPDKSIDMIMTSPPYDNIREYNKSSTWNFDVFKSIVKELERVLKDGGVIVWIVNDTVINNSETGTSFKQALYFKEIGLNLHDTMIWEKDTFSFPDKTRYRSCFEYMFVISKNKPKTINFINDRKNKYSGTILHGTSRGIDGKTFRKLNHNKSHVKEYGVRFNVWKINTEKKNKTGHPAVFPINLAQDHIKTWSNKNDIVLDCFMGSGTTGVVCKNLNRNFIGIEIDKTYFDIAKNRIESSLI
jgi:DNA modification methylase